MTRNKPSATTTTITQATLQRQGSLRPRRSGRPLRQTAEKLRDHILDVATPLFLEDGYGSTSIEMVAQQARISKRTFYHRFPDKAALFGAVVRRIIEHLHPPAEVPLTTDGDLRENLLALGQLMARAAVTPLAIALHRLIVSESARFPELAVIVGEQGGIQEAVTLVATLLKRESFTKNPATIDPHFAARQFLQMVISIPQRRALGLGIPMSSREIDDWVMNTVDLFLCGCPGRAKK